MARLLGIEPLRRAAARYVLRHVGHVGHLGGGTVSLPASSAVGNDDGAVAAAGEEALPPLELVKIVLSGR